MKNKICKKCGLTKSTSDFYTSALFDENIEPWCKACRAYGNECLDCGNTISRKAKRCSGCRQRGKLHSKWKNGIKKACGYNLIMKKNHPNAHADGRIAEHIYVMTKMVGRPLIKGETVHHKNGIRNDNRPENLELWASNHPPGQRIEDLVKWANEILDKYLNIHRPNTKLVQYPWWRDVE